MHDIFSREPDPLDGMLAPPSPADTDALRQTVYARTRRVLRRGRRLRQCVYGVALAASFAAGLLVMRVAAPKSPPPQPEQLVEKPEAPRPVEKPAAPQLAEPAIAREWEAFDSDNRRAELYRRAGETYLKQQDDVLSAVRCYGNALDSGTERDRAVSADDDYLLMAIKIARQKEKNHAENDG